jgi:hypothetical protein
MTHQFSSQDSDIVELPIADGLKELLTDYALRRRILSLQSCDLASVLGIDDYIAKIIFNAARKH